MPGKSDCLICLKEKISINIFFKCPGGYISITLVSLKKKKKEKKESNLISGGLYFTNTKTYCV